MNRSRRLALSVIGAAAALLLYCGSFFAKSYLENMQARKAYESLREACMPEAGGFLDTGAAGEQESNVTDSGLTGDGSHVRDGSAIKGSNSVGGGNSENGSSREGETRGGDAGTAAEPEINESFGIKWGKLKKINPQTIAWITIPGADISYPVVQGEDDEYYLHHSITGEEDSFGTIFLGCGSDKEFEDSHSFLYGHNMEGNMMFANLNHYEEQEFLRECPEFYIITPKKKFRYEIFSVQQADEQSPGFQYGYPLGSKAYKSQLKMLSEGSMYDTGVKPDGNSPIATLVTCNSRLDENIRMTVHGVCREVVIFSM